MRLTYFLPRPHLVGQLVTTLHNIWQLRVASSPSSLKEWVHVPMSSVPTACLMLCGRACALHAWHSSSVAAQLLGVVAKIAVSRYSRRKG